MRLSTLSAAAVLLLATLCVLPASAQQGPEGAAEAVRDHFAALLNEDYHLADQYFTEAFRRAFKGDVARLNQYYMARGEQAGRGFDVVDVEALDDPKLETAVCVVEFASPQPDAPVTATERIYYYLVREKVAADAPLRAADGKAWRIDIFDSFRFNSLAEARRRPYLYTNEAWPEDEGRELKSRQGLFRIQWALESYFYDHHFYPPLLLGADSRRDELISGKYFTGTYPLCGFANRPMRSVGLKEKSSGDFTYIGIDFDGDGNSEGYWLVMHGKVPSHYYFVGYDVVYILGSEDSTSQRQMAQDFAEYWEGAGGRELALTEATEPMQPRGSLVPTITQMTGEPPQDEGQEATETGMLSVAYAAVVYHGVTNGAASNAITPVAPTEPAPEPVIQVAPPPPPPPKPRPLHVYSYGF